jgi:hypothetical protein
MPSVPLLVLVQHSLPFAFSSFLSGWCLRLALAMMEYTFYRLIPQRQIRRFRKFFQNSRNCTLGEAEQQNAHEQRATVSHMAGLFGRCHVILSVSLTAETESH